MLAELSDDERNVPDWLAKASVEGSLPLVPLLHRSMFYPACGLDGRPVQYFGGATHSFVYVDQMISRESVTDALQCFKGYRQLFMRDVEQDELGITSFEPHQNILQVGRNFSYGERPYFSYAIWAVFERRDDFGPNHGPARFSLLYIGGEAVSTYWSLYWRLQIAPFAITLIKCDAFTGNWTSFFDDRAELASLVMETSRFSPPRYLFCEAESRECDSPWSWFSEKVTTLFGEPSWDRAHHQYLTVWRLNRRLRFTQSCLLIRSPQESRAGNDLQPRPLILGLGTAGEAFATRLQRGTFFQNQLVKVDVFGFGWYSPGLDRSEFDREAIEREIALASKVLLVVYGGGTTSSEMAKFSASCAQFKNVQLHAILSTPMSWEGRKRAARATSLLEFLRSTGATVTTVVSDQYYDQDEEDFRVSFWRVDDAMLKEVQAWAATASEVGSG